MAELRQSLLKGAGLLGAAGRIGLRVEVEDVGLALEVRGTDRPAAGGRHLERRRWVAFGKAHPAISPIWRMKAARTSAASSSKVARSAGTSIAGAPASAAARSR